MFRPFLCSVIVLVFLARQVSAQGVDTSIFTETNSDHMVVLIEEGVVTLDGNVDVVQGQTRMLAEHMVIQYAWPLDRNVNHIVRIDATENVRVITPNISGRGDIGLYIHASNKVSLSEDVVVTRAGSVITTNYFETDLITGDSRFGGRGNSERVRAVFNARGVARDAEEAERQRMVTAMDLRSVNSGQVDRV
jgi:lipopolysaccharide transport protein LptA